MKLKKRKIQSNISFSNFIVLENSKFQKLNSVIFRPKKAKRSVPAIQKTDPKHLLGQGLAMTVDESFKEVYLPSKYYLF